MLCYLFSFSFSSHVKLSHIEVYCTPSSALHIREFVVGICCESLPWLFAERICRNNLSWEFATRICHGYLPREFAVAICRGFFVFVSKSIFVYVRKSCLHGSKPFLYLSKFFLSVRFCLLTVFLFVIVVAVMGPRTSINILETTV